MFKIVLFLFSIYLVWRLILPLPLAKVWRWVLSIMLLMLAQYYWVREWIFGSLASPEVPRWVLLVLGSTFVYFVITVLLTVFIEIIHLIARFVLRISRAKWSNTLRIGILLGSGVLSIFGVQQAIKVPEVKTVVLPIKNLPAGLEGFKLVHLTDLHISPLLNQEWLAAVVEKTNGLQADVIAITGDLIDGFVKDRQKEIPPYAALQARYGVLASLGNHEYYFHAPEWYVTFQQLGMQVLVNQHTVLTHQGEPIVFAGVADPVAIGVGLEGPNVDKALSDAPKGVFTVLLDHRPHQAKDHLQKGVNLQLSGHTHGGMIVGFQEIVKQFNAGFVSGLYAVGEGLLYVSNGTGLWNGFPVRLGVPSEITLFILKRG
ncbi:metallophosphoesterase [Pelistega ratti]|uniref:metallophosphoesterase n=1 Tax=Pelistega ratti TaxID=2652177 RepID=UPI00135934E1|nr:metallophosphoesterase [Pelistega ratti]